MYKLSLILATFFAVARLWHIFPEGLAENSFKAFAHLFVGGLFATAFTYSAVSRSSTLSIYDVKSNQYFVMALVLSLIELLAFMLEKFPLTSL